MMVEDLGVEAKEAAVWEENDAQLSTMVAEQDAEGMISISVEAAGGYESLSDDKEIVNNYERLTALDGKRRFALTAAASHKEEAAEAEGEGGMAAVANPRRPDSEADSLVALFSCGIRNALHGFI